MKTSFFTMKYLSLILLVALMGCQTPIAAQPEINPTSPPVALKSNKARISQPQIDPNQINAVSQGVQAFGVDLYKHLGNGNTNNLFFSPYSISLALAMTEGGARGETKKQMDNALHFFPADGDQLHQAYNALDQKLVEMAKPQAGDQSEGFRLNIANAIWGQNGYSFLPAYLDLLAENYGAGLKSVDFKANPEGARQDINQWVSQETAQKIQDLIPQGAINEATRMVLANAIYFKAAWQEPFQKSSTKNQPFYLLDGKTVDVPMMKISKQLGYARGDGWQALELPYSGDAASMFILLPDPSQFQNFEQNLDSNKLTDILGQIQTTQVDVSLPRFQFVSSFALKDALSTLGMKDAFIPDQADFSGMANNRELYLSSVIHKAFIAVDEAGTEAAAATAVMVGTTAMPTEVAKFTADHPFLFLVREHENGTILFMGRLVQP